MPVQAIKLQVGPDNVERATLFVMHVKASAHDMRVGAMHHRSPIQTFRFDSKGALLVGNASAVESCRRGTSGAAMRACDGLMHACLLLGNTTSSFVHSLCQRQRTNVQPLPLCSQEVALFWLVLLQ